MCEARKRLRTWVEGVACACAVTGRVLLDATTHLTWGVASELDDMEGIQDAGSVLEQVKRWRSCCPWKGSSVAIWIQERNSSPRSASQFSCAVPDLPGTRSTQAGRGMLLPSHQVHDAGERVWAPAASVLVVPHSSHPRLRPHPRNTGWVIRCGLLTRLDMGPHGVPRGCQLSSQASDDQHCMTCTTRGSNGKISTPSLSTDARLKLIVQPAPAAAGSGLDLYEELNVHRDHVQVTEAWHQD